MKELDFLIEPYDGFVEARTDNKEVYMIYSFGDTHYATYYDPVRHRQIGSVKLCEGTLLRCILFCNEHHNNEMQNKRL